MKNELDVSNAVSEAFAIYNRFHNELNVTSKVVAAGLTSLQKVTDVEDGDKILGELVDEVKMPWGTKKSFPNPPILIKKAFNNFILNTLVQAISGFDAYLTHFVADIAHFGIRSNGIFKHAHVDKYRLKSPPEFPLCCFAYAEQYAKDNVLSTRIEKLKSDLHIEDEVIDRLIPLFELFRLIRNSISHSNAIVTKELSDFYEGKEWEKSLTFWNSLSRNPASSLPFLRRGKKIELTLPIAILSSAICFRIAIQFNSHLPRYLGEQGFLEMGAYYGLLVEHHEFRPKHAAAVEAVVSYFLSSRYFVKDFKTEEIPHRLKKYDLLKDCQNRFTNLYPNRIEVKKIRRH